MIPAYKRKAGYSAVICVVGMAILITYAENLEPGGNIWDDGLIPAQIAMLVSVVSWFYAHWAFVTAKGRSGAWALLGAFFPIGLLVILCLTDKQKSQRHCRNA